MEYIIKTKDLTKTFGTKQAVNKVNMNIKKGDIYGFIGKNGAGKTTTMKLILGTIFPTNGSIELFESSDLDKNRRRIGSLIEAPGLYANFSAYENMKRFSIIYGGTDKEIKEHLRLVGLANTGNKKAGEFSLGMRQRLGIAIALLGNPELLILDEPINGLDPAGIKEVRDIILKINKERGVTFLISSHLLDELSKIVTRYGIINNGNLVEEISVAELEARCKQFIKIEVNNTAKAKELLKTNLGINDVEVIGKCLNVYSHFDKVSDMNEVLVTNGIKVSELTSSKVGFEEYFIERIGK